MQGDTQLVECLHEGGINLLGTLAVFLWGGVVDNVLIVDFGKLEMPPVRLGHLLPAVESVQAEVQQPLRFLFDGGDGADCLFRQPFGNVNLFHLGDESFLVLLGDYVFKQVVHSFTGGRSSVP